MIGILIGSISLLGLNVIIRGQYHYYYSNVRANNVRVIKIFKKIFQSITNVGGGERGLIRSIVKETGRWSELT